MAAGVAPAVIPAATIVIPAFNEAAALGAVLRDIQAVSLELGATVTVIDDGSSDATAEVARAAGATVVRHARNLGYGAALKTGIRDAATEYVITMDADGQHDGAALRRVWARRAEADMVVGARQGLLHSRAWRMPSKWFLRAIAAYLTRQPIVDLNSGLRVYRRSVLMKYLHLCPSGFSFTTTMTLAMLGRGWRVFYEPIDIRPRQGVHSTVTVRTGLETIILVLRLIALFNPLRVFVPAAVTCALAGLLWGLPIALLGRGISVGSMLAVVTGVVLFALGLLCDQISQLRLERFE